MKPLYLFTLSMISLVAVHADPTATSEAFPAFPQIVQAEPETASINEELSVLDDDFQIFEEELNAFEEEIKNDTTLSDMAIVDASLSAPSTDSGQMDEQILILDPDSDPISEQSTEILNVDAEQTDGMEDSDDNQNIEEEPASPDTQPSQESDDQSAAFAPLPVEQQLDAELQNEVVHTIQEPLSRPGVELIHSSSSIASAAPEEATAVLNIESNSATADDAIQVDFQRAFSGSPVIYTILLGMSIFSVCIWLYSLISLQSSTSISANLKKNLQSKLNSNQFDEALNLCQNNSSLFCKMVASGIHSRRHGLSVMVEAMKAEGKRASVSFWQKIGLLNDIAIIAPMIGLLGTVLGMFYAFYDMNRSIESITTLFDGLGVSVGATVAGLFVAILSLVLHSLAKYRLVRALALVENEAQNLALVIDDRTSLYQKS